MWPGFLLAILLVGTVGCGSTTPGPVTPQDEETGLRKVTLQLNWLSDAQHGGFYAAQREGYYADEGLDVEIVPGGPGTAVLPKVALGRCDFAIANADQVLLARAQEADVVAVFASMQNSPRCIMVHQSSGITALDQLANITLALGDGKAFAEYLKKNIPLSNVRLVSYTGTVAKFLIDKDFAQQGYVFSEPLVAAAQGSDPLALMVSELGFNPYSSVVVVNRKFLDADSGTVDKFVRASRKGWQAYVSSPAAANKAIIAVNPDMNAEILEQSAAEIGKLCKPNDFTGAIGDMSLDRWDTLRKQLIEIELLKADAGPASEAFVIPRP